METAWDSPSPSAPLPSGHKGAHTLFLSARIKEDMSDVRWVEQGEKMSSPGLLKHVPAEPVHGWVSGTAGVIKGTSEQVMKLESQR